MGTGTAVGTLPESWSETENLCWKTEVVGTGHSTPVVAGHRVFLSTAIDTGKVGDAIEDERPLFDRVRNPSGAAPKTTFEFRVLSFDLETGKEIWNRLVATTQPTAGGHTQSSFATSSLVTDGNHIYAFFGSRGLFALDLEGEVLWQRDFGEMQTRRGFGESSSPALADGVLIVPWDHEGDSAVIALDAETGTELWRQPRIEATSWASPIIVPSGDGHVAVLSAPNSVRGYDLTSGELLWSSSAGLEITVSSPIAANGLAYVVSSNAMGADNDIRAFQLEPKLEEIWTVPKLGPYVSSPLHHDGRIVTVKGRKSIFMAYDASTGEVLTGPVRIRGLGEIYASPIAANGRALFVSRDGTAALFDVETLEAGAINTLDDQFSASPILVGDRLLLRGHRHLYCVGAE